MNSVTIPKETRDQISLPESQKRIHLKDILNLQLHETQEDQLLQKPSFFQNLYTYSTQRINALSKTILFDRYIPKNNFPFTKKQKILKYLKAKCLTQTQQLNHKEKIKFNNFQPQYFDQKINLKNLNQARQFILQGKTVIQAAQDDLKRVKMSKKYLQIKFLNEAAYQFDKQRKNSICWGLFFGALVCSTIYRTGSTARKAALFLGMGHGFGQISYHYHIDRYFDSVYNIFEAESIAYVLRQIQRQGSQQLTVKRTIFNDS